MIAPRLTMLAVAGLTTAALGGGSRRNVFISNSCAALGLGVRSQPRRALRRALPGTICDIV